MTAEIIYVNFNRRQVVRKAPARSLWDDIGQDPVLDAAIKARIAEVNAALDENARRFSLICQETTR